MANLTRIITKDGSVLAAAMNSTDMVAAAEGIHKSGATVTAAIGRLITAASLIGSMIKEDNASVTLRVAGGGPAGPITAVSDAFGNARVTVANAVVDLPLNAVGKLDVAGVVGNDGLLSVVRDYGRGEPQTGHCRLVTGEIGDDITEYFATSEQIPTVCALGVLVNPELTVAAAGGMLLQLLPGADDDTIERIEKNLLTLPAISSMIRDGLSPLEMLERALNGFELEIIDQFNPEYRCDCSRARVERALISLGKEELERLAHEQEKTMVECHFCDKEYSFTPHDLVNLLQ